MKGLGNMDSHHAIEALEEPHQPFDAVIGKLPAFQPGMN